MSGSEAVPYVFLLRGINVGGHRKVPMAELRTALGRRGWGEVRTHLQSGNVVALHPPGDPDELAARIAADIAAHFGFEVPVIGLDAPRLRAVAEALPFPTEGVDPRHLHVTFLSAPADPAALAARVDPEGLPPDTYRVGDRVLYLSTPDGLGRSKLAEALARPSVLGPDVVQTTRNLNTVRALLALTDA
ncbi:DUF1697 domain-containing protein [Streptomyces sp. BI20]|uniref:DUF1697 domain-containing protein n=1 Tax=Streptomyces sp. BI20 TaxID=3403460 RepID=UPI003C75BEEA